MYLSPVKRFLPLLIFILIPALALYQVSAGLYVMKYDMMNQFFPNRYFISECLRNHVLPLWCPYVNFGYPFHADPQGGMFYPPTTLISLLAGYNIYTAQLEYLLHLAIAGTGFYLLLRNLGISRAGSLVFGVVYSLSGVFIGNAQHLTWVITLAWMPFILLSFYKYLYQPSFYHAVLLALSSALALTGGYIGILIIAVYFFIAYFLFHIINRAKQTGWQSLWPIPLSAVFGGLLFILLAGGYLFSFAESLEFIARGKPVNLHQANDVPLSPQAAISFLFPFATSCRALALNTDISMANIYCGFLLLPLLFITFFKARLNTFQKALFIFAVICLGASLGKYFVVRTFLYHFFPGLNLLRHAAIFRVFTIVGLLAVVPAGFDWWSKNISSPWARNLLLGWLVLLAGIFVFGLVNSADGLHLPALYNSNLMEAFNASASVWQHIVVQAGIQLLLLLFILVVLFIPRLSERAKVTGISLLILADIAIAAQMNIVSTVISEVRVKTLQAELNKVPKGFPVPALIPIENYNEFGNPSTNPIWFNYSMFTKTPSINGFNSFFLQEYENVSTWPDRAEWVKKPFAFFKDTTAAFTITRFAPGEIIVAYNSTSANELTVLESYYKGWGVSVDAVETQLHKQHGYFLSCSVPAGKHQVRFVYERTGIKIMYFLTLLLFAGGAGFAFYYRKRQTNA